MNILVDTNVILDVVLQRDPWLADAAEIWAACETGLVRGHLQASAITDIYYIVRRATNLLGAFSAVDECMRIFTIVPVERQVLEQARQLSGMDFEDNVQIACAVAAGLDAIVTRDPAGPCVLIWSETDGFSEIRFNQGVRSDDDRPSASSPALCPNCC